MVTIKDVARQAGVSVTTASYALNETGAIKEETRKRVLTAAEELNYHPNAFARHLKKGQTTTIGVFITRFGGAFYEEILEGIHDAILKTDYELIVCPESRAVRRLLAQRQVDGAIIFDSKVQSNLIAKLASPRFPIVVLDRNLEGEHVFPLLLDNAQGTREVFHHLYNQGARRLGFVSGARDSFDNQERARAFLDEAAQHGLHVPTCEGNFTEQSGYAAADALIKARALPEAVFCANDQMAIGFIKALQAHGARIPDDVAVVGFDDIAVARYMRPTLSTVGASRFHWGSQAAARLLGVLENQSAFGRQRIHTQLIARESSARDFRAAP